MLDHILVPLDGSSLAECVLPHAVALGRAFDARLTLMQVVERFPDSRFADVVDPLEWHMIKSEADAYLNEVTARLREIGLRTGKALLEGKVPERIIDFARREDVDLIALSSHGRSGLSGWNISSVVQKVILRAYVPTMIVRAYQTVPDELTELSYNRVLVPLDGSLRAECVLPLASTLSEFHQCELLLTHVVNKPEAPRRMPLTEEETELVEQLTEINRKRGTEYLDDLKARFSPDVETRLLISDNTAAALHDLIAQEDIELVLASAHGYSGQARWPYGGVTLNLIAYGTVPLLIVQDVSKTEQTQAEKAAQESKGH